MMKRIAILLSIYILLMMPAAPAQAPAPATGGSADSSQSTSPQAPEPEKNNQMLRAAVQDNELFGDGNASRTGQPPAQPLRRDPMLDGQATTTQPMAPMFPGQATMAQPVAPMLPGMAVERPPMQLNAQKNVDPDKDNREVMLAWDKWRNHF